MRWEGVGRRSGLRLGPQFADILGPEVCVAFEFVPGVVERELRDLVDLVAAFEKPTGGLVPHVMEVEVLDTQHVTGIREGIANAFGLIWKDDVAGSGLLLDDRPGFGCVLETAMIALLIPRVLRIPDKPAAR